MINYPQFCLWTIVKRHGDEIKLPISASTLSACDAHNPESWADYGKAIELAGRYGFGLAFALTANDPFFFIDIDGALQDGQWSGLSHELIAAFPGAASEISNSGAGIHIIGCYAGEEPAHGCKNIELGIELYTSKRFIALSDVELPKRISQYDNTVALNNVIAKYFLKTSPDITTADWTDEACEGWCGPESDEKLIQRALRSKSAASVFGSRASFKDLWRADADSLAIAYPDNYGQRSYDESSADAALAQHLAFWTGKNCERIERLMWASALVREKWGRADYLHRTIIGAVSKQKEVYNCPKDRPRPPAIEASTPIMSASPAIIAGYQYLTADMQLQHFSGCVYIQDLHRILTPSGALLKSEQFNATYGGYVFQLDETGDKTTRKAWEAFTESQVARFPKSESTCFRPDLSPCQVYLIDGKTAVNCYIPIEIQRKQGDPSRFLDHLAKVLPDERDRIILLSYMAACVQYKGIKFQWAPLLQGTEGNGKTLFTRCVAAAIGRRYVHYPKAMDIDNKFNGWLLNKLFIGVEDIYVPDNRREVLETLKPMITGGDGLEIQLKGVDQITANICANFMLNSNHRDALRKTESDRRFAVFYTAQQNAEDLEKFGMQGDYFPLLYEWLRAEGFAIVSEYLYTYPIPDEFNPAGRCHRAPETSTTREAISASLGRIEQEIMEAVEEARSGFAGGWISSMALDKLLNSRRADRALPPNKRRDALRSLGYDWHPGLKGGRVNNVSIIDNGKPRLFIKRGHPHVGLTNAAEILRVYTEAQHAIEGGFPS